MTGHKTRAHYYVVTHSAGAYRRWLQSERPSDVNVAQCTYVHGPEQIRGLRLRTHDVVVESGNDSKYTFRRWEARRELRALERFRTHEHARLAAIPLNLEGPF